MAYGYRYGSSVSERKDKGKSLIGFPESYCIVDTETTGLSPSEEHIIEIGAIRIEGGVETGRFQSLIQPPKKRSYRGKPVFVDSFISSLTGISNQMLLDARTEAEVLPEFAAFLGDSLIVGYNVGFDVNFLYDAYERVLGKPLCNDFIDLLRMVKKLYPEMPRHRLQDLAEKFRVDTEGEHRALADVIITRECGKRIQKDILRRYESLEAFQMLYPKSCRLPNPVIKPSKEAALSGQHCVISGRIETISRAETKALIESLGGIQDEAVSRKTSILILGNGLYGANKPGEKSVKQKKAEQYRESGQEIEILTEEEFFTRIRR